MGDRNIDQHGTTRLKLGKGSVFVKSQLKRLPFLSPEDNDDWEVDFQQIPDDDSGMDGWFGMVIGQEFGGIFADRRTADPPTVNDLATLLGEAMRRPLDSRPHRPQRLD